jgi:hypothetical protein
MRFGLTGERLTCVVKVRGRLGWPLRDKARIMRNRGCWQGHEGASDGVKVLDEAER